MELCWFYYKEICCDARSHERKILSSQFVTWLTFLYILWAFLRLDTCYIFAINIPAH